jgi:hypothetical protein
MIDSLYAWKEEEHMLFRIVLQSNESQIIPQITSDSHLRFHKRFRTCLFAYWNGTLASKMTIDSYTPVSKKLIFIPKYLPNNLNSFHPHCTN